jgi:hypothetical protein
MYTWGNIKDNVLGILALSEEEAQELNLVSRFTYYANEAMTQICNTVKPKYEYVLYNIEGYESLKVSFGTDFLGFVDDEVYYQHDENHDFVYADELVEFRGSNEILFKAAGKYLIPQRKCWYFFDEDISDVASLGDIPQDVCEAIVPYIASKCFTIIDDERKAIIYRNEFEVLFARLEDTRVNSGTFHIRGGW